MLGSWLPLHCSLKTMPDSAMPPRTTIINLVSILIMMPLMLFTSLIISYLPYNFETYYVFSESLSLAFDRVCHSSLHTPQNRSFRPKFSHFSSLLRHFFSEFSQCSYITGFCWLLHLSYIIYCWLLHFFF